MTNIHEHDEYAIYIVYIYIERERDVHIYAHRYGDINKAMDLMEITPQGVDPPLRQVPFG